MDREGFEPSISPMQRAYPTSLDDRPIENHVILTLLGFLITKFWLYLITDYYKKLGLTYFCDTY